MAAPEDDIVITPVAPARVAPRKLSLRVGGAKLGSRVRPAPLGAAVPAVGPTRTIGLRVHVSALARREAAAACIDPHDCATADDYES